MQGSIEFVYRSGAAGGCSFDDFEPDGQDGDDALNGDVELHAKMVMH